MSTGLAASIVTPGSTAPVVSLTAPLMEPCARAVEGSRNTERRKTSLNELVRAYIECLQLATVWRDEASPGGPCDRYPRETPRRLRPSRRAVNSFEATIFDIRSPNPSAARSDRRVRPPHD